PGSRVGRALWHRNDRTASRRAPKADARWSPSASLPPTLASRTTFRLAASFSAARDSLGVPRRELLRHGSSRLHANPVQVFMRPVLVVASAGNRGISMLAGYGPAFYSAFSACSSTCVVYVAAHIALYPFQKHRRRFILPTLPPRNLRFRWHQFPSKRLRKNR